MGCRLRAYLQRRGAWKERTDAPKQQDMDSRVSQAQGATGEEQPAPHRLSRGVGPRVCSLESAGERGWGEWRWAIGRATRGKKGPGGSLVTEAGPSCLQPQPLPARPGQASSCWKSFQPQRSEVCSPSPGTKLHPARPAGSHPWGLRPCSPGQTAPRGREGWTNIREWGLEGNIWVSQGMH